jgi:uncharacterized protein (TIGR01777 family)
MTAVLIAMIVQGLMGALDNFWHHEFSLGLPARVSARREIALHSAREGIYGLMYLTLAWVAWQGVWAWVLMALIAAEVIITLADFIEEDQTRRLPHTERVLHTLLAIGFGIIIALFAPILLDWTRLDTGFAGQSQGLLSLVSTVFGVGVLAWSVRNAIAAFSHRGAQVPRQAQPSGRTVLITGATGFIGGDLVDQCLAKGDRVAVLSRDLLTARARFGPDVLVFDSLDQVPADMVIDAIVNLAGGPVIAGPWTKGRRRSLMASRINTTRNLNRLVARLQRKPAVLVNGSAVGFYGDRGETLLTEASLPGEGFMADLCHDWEVEALRLRDHGVRVCTLRLGMVFDWSGGPLPMLTLSNLFGLGIVFGSGRQGLPWIHRDDVLRLIEVAISDARYDGPINAVAPDLLTQGEFAALLARVTGRPLFLTAPAWPMRAVLGEFSDLFLASQKVVPQRLQAFGFRYAWPRLEPLLAHAKAQPELEPYGILSR